MLKLLVIGTVRIITLNEIFASAFTQTDQIPESILTSQERNEQVKQIEIRKGEILGRFEILHCNKPLGLISPALRN